MLGNFMGAASALLLFPSLAWADFGAIAFSQDTGAVGYSYGATSRRAAENRAISGCAKHAYDCRTVLYFNNACGALAIGENYGYGVAWNTNRNAAQNNALRACQRNDDGCYVIRWACSG